MAHSSRNCTRCWKELTDAASMEAGIGPVCRNLDNELLARLIPSNLPAAKAAFEEVDLSMVAPETLRTLTEVHTALFADDASSRADWRVEVKRIEWALSFPANNFCRADLTKVIATLGYVGLAALWNGEAATGKALCSFVAGRLVVSGPRNKAANMAIRKINGRKWHDGSSTFSALLPGMDKKGWSVPAKEHEAFFSMVITHYPNFSGLNEAIEQAKAYNASAPAATPAPAAAPAAEVVVNVPAKAAPPAAPKCSMVEAGLFLKITSPYNPDFITDLKKSVTYTDRRWNAAEKVWEVVAIHKDKVTNIVKKHYGADAFEAVSAS